MESKIASINAQYLYKGQVIPAEQVWDYFVTRKPEKLDAWITEYGDEEMAKAARMPSISAGSRLA